MRKDFIHYLAHEFAHFSLEKDGGTWHLNGQERSLSPLETEVLVKLIEEKGYVVNVENVVSNRSSHPEKIVQNIRKALGSKYVRSRSRCEYIETVHREGVRWIYDPVRSRGFACLELRPIITTSTEVATEMLFLQASIESRVKSEMNLSVYTSERPTNAQPHACFVIEGNCLSVRGIYRLILRVSCLRLNQEHRSFEVKTNNLYKLIDDATEKVLGALRDLIPETIRF